LRPLFHRREDYGAAVAPRSHQSGLLKDRQMRRERVVRQGDQARYISRGETVRQVSDEKAECFKAPRIARAAAELISLAVEASRVLLVDALFI
jgi:hypothetical protein